MKRIRIHNDIQITWAITINKQSVSLADKKLSLQLVVFNHVIDVEDFSVTGNVIRFKFSGTEQKRCGRYTLVLRDSTSGKLNTIDKVSAFELVPHTYEQGGEDNPKVALEVVELSTDTDSTTIGRAATIRVDSVETLDYSQNAYVRNAGTINEASLVFGIPRGKEGKSAFDVAQENGFSGTIKEWLNSLKANIGSTLKSIDDSSTVGNSLPTNPSCLYYNGKAWEWKPIYSDDDISNYLVKNGYATQDWVKNQNYGSGSGSGGSVSQDQIDTAVSNALSNYSWWGRTFSSGTTDIVGDIHTTAVDFMTVDGKSEKKLKLDANGDLYFDGNFYATGGITALGQTSGGGSSSGSIQVATIPEYSGASEKWISGSKFRFYQGTSLQITENETKGCVDIVLPSSSGGSSSGGVQCYLNGVSVGTFSKMYFSGNVEVSKNSYDDDMANIKVTGGSSSGGSATNPYMLFFYGSSTASGTPSLVDGYDGSSAKYLQFKGSGVRTYSGTTNNSGDTTIVEITGGSGGTSVDLSEYLKKTDASAMYLGINGTAKAASKLATARSIWGQTFDGTNNVSGNLSGVGDIFVSKSTFSLLSNGKSLMGLNSNKDLYIGYGFFEDTDANTHITLYGSKTLINTYDGSNHHNFWFKENYLSIPDDGELRIGNGKLVWDETNKAFRMTSTNGGDCNFYCDGGITALGIQSTSASNSDFTFKSVKVNERLYIGGTDKYFEQSGNDLDLFMENRGKLYFDNGSESYCLMPDGSVDVYNLNVDGMVNMAGVGNLNITKSGNSFIMSFTLDGKTYKFEPSEQNVSIS